MHPPRATHSFRLSNLILTIGFPCYEVVQESIHLFVKDRVRVRLQIA